MLCRCSSSSPSSIQKSGLCTGADSNVLKTHLAHTGHSWDHNFAVKVVLFGIFTEEQVDLVIVTIQTLKTLTDKLHVDKSWLWKHTRTNFISLRLNYGKISQRLSDSPLSQLLLVSVRRGNNELRNTTGSEPKKFMEVAEYRSLSVLQEQEGRLNSSGQLIIGYQQFQKPFIHNSTKQFPLLEPSSLRWKPVKIKY